MSDSSELSALPEQEHATAADDAMSELSDEEREDEDAEEEESVVSQDEDTSGNFGAAATAKRAKKGPKTGARSKAAPKAARPRAQKSSAAKPRGRKEAAQVSDNPLYSEWWSLGIMVGTE